MLFILRVLGLLFLHFVKLYSFQNDGKCVRVDLTICFVCQTFIDPPPAEGEPITRDNLLTKITYCSVGKLF